MSEIQTLADALAYLSPHASTKGPVILTPDKMRQAVGIIEEQLAVKAPRVVAGICPWDAVNDPRSNISVSEPCPVCGMLGTGDAEDVCLGGPRR